MEEDEKNRAAVVAAEDFALSKAHLLIIHTSNILPVRTYKMWVRSFWTEKCFDHFGFLLLNPAKDGGTLIYLLRVILL